MRGLLVGLALVLPARALAYVRATLPDGTAVHWRESTLHYSVERTTSGPSTELLRERARVAFDRWQQGCSPIVFIEDGVVEPSAGGEDGRNVVRAVSQGWCTDGATCRGATNAVTRLFVDSDGGIREADIELNAEEEQFYPSDSGEPEGLDLDAVLTHETGHFLGLAHAPQGEPGVMVDGHTRLPNAVGTLSADEMQFSCDVYAEGAFNVTQTPVTPRARSSGCGGGSALTLAALLPLGWRRRRSMLAALLLLATASPAFAGDRPLPTLQGPRGVFRAIDASTPTPGEAALSLRSGLFYASPFLVQGAARDSDTGLWTLVTYARTFPNLTLLRNVEWSLSLNLGWNDNQRNDPGRRDGRQQVTIGNLTAGLRGGATVARGLSVGGSVRARLLTTPFTSGYGAFSLDGDALVSYDFRAISRAPVRLHFNFGGRGDTSLGSLPEAQCSTSAFVDSCIRSRAVFSFAYGLAAPRIGGTAAVEAPLAVKAWTLTPFIEYGLHVAVGPGDQVIAKALAASAAPADSFADRTQQVLTLGSRFSPDLPISFDVAVDIGLQQQSSRYGARTPPWQVMLGVAYVFESSGILAREDEPVATVPTPRPAPPVVAVVVPVPAPSSEPASAPASAPSEEPAPVAAASNPVALVVAPSALLFKVGETTLEAPAKEALDALALQLKDSTATGIEIVGHTDNAGPNPRNQTLSEKRANVVRDYLVSKGIAPARLVARGAGSSSPLVPNLTPGNRAKNNRVEIKLPQ